MIPNIMLSPKTKGLFVEVGDFSILTATTSSTRAPFVIEAVKEYPVPGGWGPFREDVLALNGNKRNRFTPARCAVYPESRFFRRHSIESTQKAKDPLYFSNLITDQYKIDLVKNVAAVVNVTNGTGFSTEIPINNQKELLVCGARRIELDEDQETLVDCAIFPETLELGTLSTLGGLVHYMNTQEMNRPTMMLELTPENAYLFIVSREQVDICRPIPFGLNVMFPTIREELGLKDDESARKLFYSNTFDFTEMGPALLRKILKELQASIGFYEVQTGQTVGRILVTMLPSNLNWVQHVICRALGLESIEPDYEEWLGNWGITASDAVDLSECGSRWMGLFSLMANYDPEKNGTEEK